MVKGVIDLILSSLNLGGEISPAIGVLILFGTLSEKPRSDGSHLEQEFEEGGNSTVNANHVIQNEENEIKFEMPQNLPTGEFKDLELLIDGEKMHNFTKKEYDIGDGFGHFGLVVDDAFGMELLRTQDDPKSKVP
ncbi:hypothetical protein JHK84_050386 [Glycine max]|nr:hypothetical protein JHK84_050386 [Glycine max]